MGSSSSKSNESVPPPVCTNFVIDPTPQPPQKAAGPQDPKVQAPEQCTDASFAEFVNTLANPAEVTYLIISYNKLKLFNHVLDISDATVAVIVEKFPKLVDLDLMNIGPKVTPAGLAALARIPGLKSLYLSKSQITDAHVESIGKLTNLVELDLSTNPNITDAGIAHLAGLKSLTSLSLDYCTGITAEALRTVGQLSTLKKLKICCSSDPKAEGLDDVGLTYLSGLTALEYLEASDNKRFGDAGVKSLAALKSLQTLDLGGAKLITDASLEALATITTLEELILSARGSPITDAGIAHIAKLPKLRKLFVRWCNELTDASMDALEKIAGFEFLKVEDCRKITKAAVLKFKAAHPNAKVHSEF